jgi:predicted nucleic acid-binding protein
VSKEGFVLDTSALIAFLADEKEAAEVLKVIPLARIPFICLSELYYVIWNRKDRAEADRIYGMVKSWGLAVLYPNERVILNAGRIKAFYKLGISDSYIAALTLDEGLVLVTKDKDYKILEKEIKILAL